MKFNKNKKTISAIAVALAITFVGGAVVYNAWADRRLPGLDTLIQEKTSATETFQILEIVDGEDKGEIGFYFDGNEPFSHDEDGYALSFEETLANIESAEERAAYVSSLLTRLNGKYWMQGGTGSVEDYPISYNPYSETYFPTEEQSTWDYLKFDQRKYVSINGEYVEVQQSEGTDPVYGDYTRNGTYMLAYDHYDEEADIHYYNGDYVENLAGFDSESLEPAYRVTFGTELNENYDHLGVYTREYEEAGEIVTEAAFNSLKEQNGGYYWMEVVTETETEEGTETVSSYVAVDLNQFTFADVEATTGGLSLGTKLYTMDYKYAGTTDDESGKEYYYVQDYSYAYNGYEYGGNYGAILKTGEAQYIACEAGQGTHKLSEQEYSYTPGMGTHNFVENADKPAVMVEMEGFYYTGGFVNNNWFRKEVFLASEGNIDLNIFPVKVRTLTVDQLIEKCNTNVGVFNEVDLLVINGNPAMFDKTGTGASILSNVASKMQSEIDVNKIGTIVNRNIVTGSSTSDVVTLLKGYYTASKSSSIGSVDENIYWYSGDLFNLDFAEELTNNAEVASGFQEILDYIETENRYLALREGEELLSDKVSQAVAVQYILSCKYARNDAPKEELKVLEVQPCKDYSLNAKEVKKLTGYDDLSDDAIEIVQMTTAEFVGKIHDLNGVYDFIYFGMNTGLMNTTAGETVYNDKDMNGLVYSHVGDAVLAAERLTGLLKTDYVDKNTSNLPYSRDVYMIRTAKNEAGKLVLNEQEIKEFKINTGNSQTTKSLKVGNQGVYRYSGNDITAENIEQLMDYVDAGYPVILANGFAIEGTTNDQMNAGRINSAKVDDSSYLYDFLEQAFGKENVFLKTDALSTSEDFMFYMNLPKLQLTFYKEANEGSGSSYYIENDEVTEHYPDDSETFVEKVNGKYNLKYVFKIEDRASASVLDTNYKVSLFIDINSDGKYSREHEMMQDIKVTDESGNDVEPDELLANKKYIVTRRLPDAFRSIVPWKLEVSLAEKATSAADSGTTTATTRALSSELNKIRQSQIGYSRLETEEKTDIYIYQILSDVKGNNRDNNTWNLETDYNNVNGDFRKDVDSVVEYNLDFTTDYVTDYQKPNGKELSSTDEYYATIEKYDMLILGFADVYEGFTNPYAVEAILRFIETGKSVLLTHDTTSFVNYPGDTVDDAGGSSIFWNTGKDSIGGDRWGYLLNQIVRDKLGMDRYGITSSDKFIDEYYNLHTEVTAVDGITIDEAKILLATLLKEGKILDSDAKVSSYIATDYTGTVDQLIAAADKEAAYVAGTNKAQTYPETHGYTYTAINNCEDILGNNNRKVDTGWFGSGGQLAGTHTEYLNLNGDSGVTNLGKTWTDSFEEFFESIFGSDSWLGSLFQTFAKWLGGLFDEYLGNTHNGSFDKMEISQVNKGQITEYPFKIDEKLSVASTHAQYYQLDLEADQDEDGESDIVVWYCISDGYNGNNKGAKNPYSASPNDVRNNYYIYSIGNVFYTGAGHKSVNRSEKQLFINTMVAAYNASVNEPSVNILEEENISAAELSSKNLPLEYSMATSGSSAEAYIGDSVIEIPYSVYDDNFVYASDTVKKLSVEYFIEDSTGTETINGVTVKKLDNITTTQDGASVSSIQSGQAYTAVWNPGADKLYDYIKNRENLQIFVRVKAEFVYNGVDTTLYGYDSLVLKKTNMFELD